MLRGRRNSCTVIKKSAQTGGFLFIFIFDIHFNNLLKYLCRDELSRWGVETRAIRVWGRMWRAIFGRVFCIVFRDEKYS